MKQLKKVLLLCLAILLVFALVACSGTKPSADTGKSPDSTDTGKPSDNNDASDKPEAPSTIAVTGIGFSALEDGSGTLAEPYETKVRAGYSITTPYSVSPAKASDKTVTWTVGTIAEGEFTASTTRGITVANNEDKDAVTITAAKTAIIGNTAVKATSGNVSVYVSVAVTDVTELTDWDKEAFVSDWYLDDCAYNEDNDADFEMPADSFIKNVFNVTAETSAVIVNAKALDGDSTTIAVSANDTALNSVLGGTSYTIDSVKETGLVYDLSAYIGEKVTLKIANTGADPLVLASASVYEFDATATERTNWAKAEIVSDWNIEGAKEYRSGTGEGFDLNTYDSEGFEYIYNYIAVTEDASRLAFKVRRFSQDEGRAAKVLALVNGTQVKAIGHPEILAEVPDVDRTSSYLVYDLSAYVDTTVCFVFALTNANIGHLVIQDITLDAANNTASAATSWDKNAIDSEWKVYCDEKSVNNEGFDLYTTISNPDETGDATNGFIYNYVNVTAENARLLVKARRYSQDNGIENKCLVLVNGTLLVPMGYADGNVVMHDVDNSQIQLVYDLTDYIGSKVQIAVMQPVPKSGHMVITGISMDEWDAKTASALDNWNKESIISDWNITYASEYRDVTEGFDMNTYDNHANEFIYNYVTVTAEKTDFVINVRRFSQDNGAVNAVGILVDGELLNADGQEPGYVPIADTGDTTTLTYDFSEYVGQTVQIVVIQPVPRTGHLVIIDMAFMAAV